MAAPQPIVLADDDMDALRLEALGRVPLCNTCARYAALVTAHRASRNGSPGRPALLPAIPERCRIPYCAPLAQRYGRGTFRLLL